MKPTRDDYLLAGGAHSEQGRGERYEHDEALQQEEEGLLHLIWS